MNIEVKRNLEEIVIEISGRLDTTTAPMLEKTINESIGNAKKLILDMKELKYISSAGLRVLLSSHKKMHIIGSMKIVNVCAEIMEIFEITGFDEILSIE